MKSIIGLLACLSLVSSCTSTPPEPDGYEVSAFNKEHGHTRYCGHYRFGETWYYAPNHRHTTVCRHTLERGIWILK